MRKLKLTLAYDGTDFFGFQRQPKRRTVQGTLEEALARVTGEKIRTVGAGRTDAGVHALGQVVHFETDNPMPLNRWVRAVNLTLPRDMLAISVEEADPTFHARKDACWKRYRYTLDTRPVPDIFTRRFRTHLPRELDVERMQQAADHLVGTHDFTSFSSAKSPVTDRVRTVYRCDVAEGDEGLVVIEITGSGFLYNMVRIIAGTLVQAGCREIEPEDVLRIMAARDRTRAGRTLPPEGLVMVEVGYRQWEEAGGAS